jgi:hypothetical protein
MWIKVFWVEMTYGLAGGYHPFGGSYQLMSTLKVRVMCSLKYFKQPTGPQFITLRKTMMETDLSY